MEANIWRAFAVVVACTSLVKHIHPPVAASSGASKFATPQFVAGIFEPWVECERLRNASFNTKTPSPFPPEVREQSNKCLQSFPALNLLPVHIAWAGYSLQRLGHSVSRLLSVGCLHVRTAHDQIVAVGGWVE